MNYFDVWNATEAARVTALTLHNTALLERQIAAQKNLQEAKEHERFMRRQAEERIAYLERQLKRTY